METNLSQTQANPDPKSSFALFLAGYLLDSNSSYRELCQDVMKVICTSLILEFDVYESPFDQKGVLSWLRESPGGIVDKENIIICPDDCSVFVEYHLSKSSFSDKPARLLEILGQKSSKVDYCVYKPTDRNGTYRYNWFPEIPLIIDLQNYQLRPNFITMSANSICYYRSLSNLKIQGSQDKMLWHLIDIQSVGDEIGDGVKKYKLRSANFFRYFQISYKNRLQDAYIHLSGIEMYGYLISI
jgi:hypothetical protein